MAKKQCWNCDTELDDNEAYCPKCEAEQEKPEKERSEQGRSVNSYLAALIVGVFVLFFLLVSLTGHPTSGSSESTSEYIEPTVSVNANDANTVENKPVVPQLTQEQKNIKTCEQIAKEYYETHKYEINVYDCDNMAQDVWNMLYAKGIKSQIVVGNIEIEGNYNIYQCNHAWILAEVAPDSNLAIECTSGEVIYAEDNDNYYSGFFFDNPQELRNYQNKFEKYEIAKAEYESYYDAYKGYESEFNNADYQKQQVMMSGLYVAISALKEKEQAYLKAELELEAILKSD
jgi:hypothetical protein